MKGLLRKDWYMLLKYGRTYLLITVIFLASYVMGNNSFFFFGYPTITVSMWGISLTSYDERFHWDRYSDSLPVSRKQTVSAKYLLVGIMILSTAALTGIVSVIFACRLHTSPNETLYMALLLVGIGLTSAALTMPCVFKLGTEKGRWVSLLELAVTMALFFTAGALFFDDFLGDSSYSPELPLQMMPLFAGIGLVLFILSWRLSIRFYERREL